MRKGISIILITLQLLSFQSFADSAAPNCADLLNWVYREFTISNLDKSYDRLMGKFLISIYHAQEKRKSLPEQNLKLEDAMRRLQKIDKSLIPHLPAKKKTRWGRFTSLFTRERIVNKTEFSKVYQEWKQLQKSSPQLFGKMDKKYLFDDWDDKTLSLLSELSKIEFNNQEYKNRLEQLAKKLKVKKIEILRNQKFTEDNFEQSIENVNEALMEGMNEAYQDILSNFSHVCSPDDLALHMEQNQIVCEVPQQGTSVKDLQIQLTDLANLINETGLLEKAPSVEPIVIPEYETNPDPKATYCKRPTEMVTTIVLHHTGTQKDMSPLNINNHHIERSTNGEPWYMISYNYLISEAFDGATAKTPKIFQGRAPEIKGAHAGGYTAPLNEDDLSFYKGFKIQCGHDENSMVEKDAISQMNQAGGISGNLVSFGIALLGNYDPVSIDEIDGAPVPNAHNRSDLKSVPSDAMLTKTAKLICDLKNKYKNVKSIAPHQYFRDTECPGALLLYLGEIATKVKDDCDFELQVLGKVAK